MLDEPANIDFARCRSDIRHVYPLTRIIGSPAGLSCEAATLLALWRRLPPLFSRCILPLMSLRPVRKLVGIGNVFLGTELLDIAEYDLEIYAENPEDHEHHGANWTPNATKIEGTVVGGLPIRKDLKLVTEEGYALSFYLRESFGSLVISERVLDSTGKPVC